MYSESENNANVAPVEEVRAFLKRGNFDGYMAVDLPYGLRVPGKDLSETADAVFRYPVRGKTVLDVGCRYGYFSHEAIVRGAQKAVGIEVVKEHADIAQEISRLWGRDIAIQCGDLENVDDTARFDVALLLNVLHHVVSPLEVVKKVARITKEMIIVEFATLLDPQTKFNPVRLFIYKTVLCDMPLAYIGSRKYHRTWYFSERAFTNLFVRQTGLFRNVEFSNSPRKKGRRLAFCWVQAREK